MLKNNILEYEFIRRELSDLKNCITTYMGFVIGGSGVAFLGITAIKITDDLYENIVIAYFISSIIISLVLMILFYKFNSHNRFAGYSKLLNQEKFGRKNLIKQFMSWELCMDKIRDVDENVVSLIKKINSTKLFKKTLYYEEEIKNLFCPKCFLNRILISLWLLIKTLFGQGRTRSWNFPLYVTLAFLTLSLLFIGTGFHYYFKIPINAPTNFLLIFICIILSIQIFIWSIYLIKLYDVMKGKATVEAYCWRYLPMRFDYINKYSSNIKYKIILLE